MSITDIQQNKSNSLYVLSRNTEQCFSSPHYHQILEVHTLAVWQAQSDTTTASNNHCKDFWACWIETINHRKVLFNSRVFQMGIYTLIKTESPQGELREIAKVNCY